MNIVRAKDIVGYYINLFSGVEFKNGILLIESSLEYTKDDIITAHKVLFANGIVFNYMDENGFNKHLELVDKINFIVDEDAAVKYNDLHKRHTKKSFFTKKLSEEELKDYNDFLQGLNSLKNRESLLDTIERVSNYIEDINKESSKVELGEVIKHIYESILEVSYESSMERDFISFGMEMEEKTNR